MYVKGVIFLAYQEVPHRSDTRIIYEHHSASCLSKENSFLA